MPKKILVVDDDVNIQEMLNNGLSRFGYHVQVSSSAIDALSLIERSKFDLFIIDVMMPDIDGISLCKTIRNMDQAQDIPIIILTALSDAETMNDAMLFGAVDYIVKPFDMRALKEKIESALTKSQARSSKKKDKKNN
jgi:DNA-binding response OmpR family regulator